LTQRCAQDGVHESACAWFASRSRQIDRIVNHRGSRYTGEVKELIQAQPEDGNDFTIQFRNVAPGEMFDEVIETSLPAKRAGDNLRGK
jgi:hypothetical protein